MECPCLCRPVTTNQMYGFYLDRSTECPCRLNRVRKCCPSKARCNDNSPSSLPHFNKTTIGSICLKGAYPKLNVGFSGCRETVEERINRLTQCCQQCQQQQHCCCCCCGDVKLWHTLHGAVITMKM